MEITKRNMQDAEISLDRRLMLIGDNQVIIMTEDVFALFVTKRDTIPYLAK